MNVENKRKLILWLRHSNARRHSFQNRLLMMILYNQNRCRQSKLMTMILLNKKISRRYWILAYHQGWFQVLWAARHNLIVEDLFHREFWMVPNTFEYIVNVVTKPMIRRNTTFREAIPIHKRVAIAVWRLATGNSYRSISKVFAITLQFCAVLCIIAPQFIKFPTTEVETAMMVDLFRISTDCEIPQVVGCLDSTHCKIRCPDTKSKTDYFNRKQVYSINTQAVVGERIKFLDVATGFQALLTMLGYSSLT